VGFGFEERGLGLRGKGVLLRCSKQSDRQCVDERVRIKTQETNRQAAAAAKEDQQPPAPGAPRCAPAAAAGHAAGAVWGVWGVGAVARGCQVRGWGFRGKG